MESKDKLIVALDILDEEKCFEMIEILSPEVNVFKIGIAPFTAFGQKLLDTLTEKGKKIFLDLKFHDIPNTVKNAAYQAVKKEVLMMNFHCLGGKEMLKKAVEGAREAQEGRDKIRPILLGVTILTSMGDSEMSDIGFTGKIAKKVPQLAAMAKDAGMDGVVASAQETLEIKKTCGEEFLVITPGIRPAWAVSGDQKRVVTPEQAVRDGADYIVVGRPIIGADDPREAARRVFKEMS